MKNVLKTRVRPGFTRIELALVCCVSVVCLSLMLPRLQAAREDSARMQCHDNLRKLGQGFVAFEKANGGFPPRRMGINDGKPYSGWGAFLLPHIDEAALAKKYSFNLDCYDPGNKQVVETHVKTFLCPAAPTNRIVSIQAQATGKSENPDKDTVYTVNGGANDFISSNLLLMPRTGYGLSLSNMGGTQRQAMTDGENLPVSKITDGLSCTLLVVEQAGRPEKWRSGKKEEGGSQFGMGANARGMWAGWGSIGFGTYGRDGESAAKGDATDCSVNCNNWFGIYGFHPEGANILLCDGSVRFVSTDLDPLTFAYLTTRDDGRLISPTDF